MITERAKQSENDSDTLGETNRPTDTCSLTLSRTHKESNHTLLLSFFLSVVIRKTVVGVLIRRMNLEYMISGMYD